MTNISIVRIKQVREGVLPYETEPCSSPQIVSKLIRKYIDDSDREIFGVICLNPKNEINNISTISIGTNDQTPVSVKDVFKTAILSNCTSIIVFHNHPSGSVNPSQGDTKLTNRIKECAELLEINIHDHIIVSDKIYFSYKEEGMI